MRVWKGVTVAVLAAASLSSLATNRAAAGCLACDAGLNCVAVGQGAKFCLQGVLTCTMAIPCWSGPERVPDSGEELTTWSLFELAGTAAPGIDPEAGPLAVGEAQRGRHVAAGALVDATLAHGRDLAVVLADVAGDGFAVRRTNEGSRVRLEVLAVSADTPGRVLADEVLGERDRLRVVVRVDGRDRLLVLQAAGVEGAGHPATLARLRASLRDAAHVVPSRGEPLFRVRAL